uniref:Uncharacterized protein n=1 Tax=Arundo donax TaxID=35708 RepID=A0A0A9FCB6_ARUDO
MRLLLFPSWPFSEGGTGIPWGLAHQHHMSASFAALLGSLLFLCQASRFCTSGDGS